MSIHYRTANVDGFNVTYREAGTPGKPKLLLLHGFPSASHMFRDLIPQLENQFHIVAPDLPGFGLSDMPPREQFAYTFDHIADVIERFTEVVGFDRFIVYVFDYGAPTGLRLAVKRQLVRGAYEGVYAYPFLDVAKNGWPTTIVFALVIAAAFFAGGHAMVWLDQRLKAFRC